MKKIFSFTAALAICLTLTSCGRENSLPEDTSAIEQYIEQASGTAQSEETTAETTEVTTAETTPFENLSDYDKAIRLAAEHIEEHGADHWEYILYDFDLDGIPELMEETGFMDTKGWEIYKLTGSEAADLGYMEFAGTDERYIKDGIDIIYYHGDELTLESGVHVYRDNENDEIFYVTEYTTVLHTKGFAAAIRYDVYADKLAERELYHCDFLSMDDGGASGNRYITHNILDGKKATPMYRCDCNSEGFLYCNEFGDYLSNFEYLGMIDVANYYKKEDGGSFYDYAETVKIPEKTREERFYSDDREKVTVCGEEYYADTYEANVVIDNDNFDSIDLSELKLLPCLEKLILENRSDKTINISEISDIENLTEIMFWGGDFDYSPVVKMDNVIYTNAPNECIFEMKSIRVVSAMPYTEDIDGFAPLYDMEQLEVVLHYVTGGDFGDPHMNMQLDRLEERRPDLLLIYVP
ncbi:MAG: hypothetical protein HDT21_07825 [Ruminococcus sp.]|nr:hypothetical protein [Ruminococcus sp.]